jgi:hypothetical protein
MPPGRRGEPQKGSAGSETASIGPIDIDYSVDDVAGNPIMGSSGRCVDKLGIRNVVFDMSFGTSHKDATSSLGLMAASVVPHFVQ